MARFLVSNKALLLSAASTACLIWVFLGTLVASPLARGVLPLTPTEVAVHDLCGRASQLLEEGDAVGALELVDSLRAPALQRLQAGIGVDYDRQMANACEAERNEAVLLASINGDGVLYSDGWLIIGAAVLTVVLCRLILALTAAPWKLSTRARRGAWGVGGASLVGVGLAVVMLSSDSFVGVGVGALGVLFWLGGCLLLAMYWGGRTRIRISVLGDSPFNEVRLADLATRIAKVGAFSSVLRPVSVMDVFQYRTGGNTRWFARLWRRMVLPEPWTVTVAADQSGEYSALSLSRNGHVVDAVLLEDLVSSAGVVSLLGTRSTQLVAVSKVVRVLRDYHPDLPGLRASPLSIAAHYCAGLRGQDLLATRRMLEIAVRSDPENVLARADLLELTCGSKAAAHLSALRDLTNREFSRLSLPDPFTRSPGRLWKVRGLDFGDQLLTQDLLLRYVTAGRKFVAARVAERERPTSEASFVHLPEVASITSQGQRRQLKQLLIGPNDVRYGIEEKREVTRTLNALDALLCLLRRPDGIPHSLIVESRRQVAVGARILSWQVSTLGGPRKLIDRAQSLTKRTENWLADALSSPDGVLLYELACYFALLSTLGRRSLPADGSGPAERALQYLTRSVAELPLTGLRARDDPELVPLSCFSPDPSAFLPSFSALIGESQSYRDLAPRN